MRLRLGVLGVCFDLRGDVLVNRFKRLTCLYGNALVNRFKRFSCFTIMLESIT